MRCRRRRFGHGVVEDLNRRGGCLIRSGHGAANLAGLKHIALAVIFTNRRARASFAETRRRLQLDRGQASPR